MNSRPIIEPSMMIEQAESLPKLITDHVRIIDNEVQKFISDLNGRNVEHLYVTGCGDSYHAALAAEMAFENIANINCEPVNGLRFLGYTADHLLDNSIVMGVSASGSSARIVEAIKAVKKIGVLTVGVTGNLESPIAMNAELVISVDIPFIGWSPGVRTYEASLLGLYIAAIRLGQYKDQLDEKEANSLIKELLSLSDVILETNKISKEISKKAARNFKDSPAILFLGSGPNFGTALFSAAKICESCGLISFGQDLEEFAHVEGLCYPDDLPVVIFVAEGKSHWRAVEIANYGKALGKRVMVVATENDDIFNEDFNFSVPLPGNVREEFSPLYYHLISDFLAGYLAEELGRKLFRSDQNRTSTTVSSNIQLDTRHD